MYSDLTPVTALEQSYDGPPPHRAIRHAQFGGDSYVKRRAASERHFYSKEAAKAVFAISRLR
ncbi:MAG: hypothetical protein ACKVKG_17710, partial [Alphaproteobacteria bacterium]